MVLFTINCGIKWWENVLEFFPKNQIDGIDAMILLNTGFESIGGLDNIRDFTMNYKKKVIEIYLTQEVYDSVEKVRNFVKIAISICHRTTSWVTSAQSKYKYN